MIGGHREVSPAQLTHRRQMVGQTTDHEGVAGGWKGYDHLGTCRPGVTPLTKRGHRCRAQLLGRRGVMVKGRLDELAPFGRIRIDDRPAGLRHQPRRDPSPGAERSPGPHLPGLENRDLTPQPAGHSLDGARLRTFPQGLRQVTKTDRAPAALLGTGVVEGLLQQLHQTALPAGVGTHDVRLATPGGDDGVIVILVVGPFDSGRAPSSVDPLDHSIYGKLLEHELNPSPSKPGLGLERRDRGELTLRIVRQTGEQTLDLHSIRDRRGRKVVPYTHVGIRRQQRHQGVVDAATRTSHLLVVGHRRRWRTDVHDETKIRFVVTHAQSGCSDQGLEPVTPQRVLKPLSLAGLQCARVCRDLAAITVDELHCGSETFGVSDGQGVDDPGALEPWQVVNDPGEPFDRRE